MIFQIFRNRCLVIRIWRSAGLQIELCIFKPFCSINWHKHQLVDVEVCHIWGTATYAIRYPCEIVIEHKTRWRDTFRLFTVMRNHPHKADVGWRGLITLSCQRWQKQTASLNQQTITNDYIDIYG